MLVYVVTIVVATYIFQKLFLRSFEKGEPPGPKFRLPIIGQMHLLGKYSQSDFFAKYRELYGDVFSLQQGITKAVVISDFEILKEVLEDPNFDGRDITSKNTKKAIQILRGGHGRNGIAQNFVQAWKEQRRFALHNLKNFGFGKTSSEASIKQEAIELCQHIKDQLKANDEMKLDLKLNLAILNVLWHIVVGERHDLDNPKQTETMEKMNELFSSLGFNKFSMYVSMMLVNVGIWTPEFKKVKAGYDFFFATTDKVLREHKETFDENNLRDYVDCYILEMKKVEENNETTSSFYREAGYLNFRASLFDLFLAGSETTSTTLLFAIMFLMMNPEVQKKAQDEIDRITGRQRYLEMSDRDDAQYLNALIAEVQRCANIGPFALPHTTLSATKIRNFKIPKQTVIYPNLALIFSDPQNFPEPEKFKPERFINPETGRYKPDPKLIPFGIGGHYCPGKTLAAMELFLFLGIFLQRFTFRISRQGPPDLNNVKHGITRVPKPFLVKISERE